MNGIPGSTRFTDGQWLGFLGNDLEAVIELKEVIPINRICTSFLQDADNYIFLPAGVECAISEDGKTFKKVEFQAPPAEEGSGNFRKVITAVVPATKARFIKITTKNVNALPWESPAKERKTWLFVDEVVVDCLSFSHRSFGYAVGRPASKKNIYPKSKWAHFKLKSIYLTQPNEYE